MKDLIKKLKPFFPFFLALIGGVVMPYGFAPYDMGLVSILSCTLFLFAIAKQKPLKSFLLGWLFGLGMFGVGTNWVYVSINTYGDAPPLLAGIITGLFVMTIALFPAFLAFTLNKIFPRNNGVRVLLAFPALWVVFEILRGWVFTGFPWLFVGYSQGANHLKDLAPIGSVWLVSWATVFVSSVLYGIVDFYAQYNENKKYRNKLIFAMVSVWALGFGANQLHWVTPSDRTLSVALVQGNIAQLLRWDANSVSEIVQTYENLTSEVLSSDLIVWPEAAIPQPLPESLPLFKAIDALGKANNTAIFAGVPSELPDKAHYYNSLIGVGLASGIYHKSHLVPFGEYVPFENTLRGLIGFFNLPMSSMVSGPTEQKDLTAKGFHFAPAICYEIAYPIFVQEMSKNADFIVTVSNDAWFGHSIGPSQHLQIAQFRALENGKYVIRATNTGITALIDEKGQIRETIPAFTQGVLKGTAFAILGQTFWSLYGIWPLAAALGFVLLLAGILRMRQKD